MRGSILLLITTVAPLSSAFTSHNLITPFTRSSRGQPNNASMYICSSALYGVKRGSLRRNVDSDGTVNSVKKVAAKKRLKSVSSSQSSKSVNKNNSGGVSPALAQWAASTATATTATTTSTTESVTTDQQEDYEEEVVEYAPFQPETKKKNKKEGKKQLNNNKNTSERRTRQSQRMVLDEMRRKESQKTIAELEALLEETSRDVDAILAKVAELTSNKSSSSNGTAMKALCGGSKQREYRMAWAGSDDAICHLGTGLHKVPLARLQEVFMKIGKGRMEMYEVIRILGPFPNIKNTLQGDVGVINDSSNNNDQPTLDISFDSMIDGTGKEILAGKEENVRNVQLITLHSSEDVLVCLVPNDDDSEDATAGYGENGSKLLLFLKEEDMDTKLAELRVN